MTGWDYLAFVNDAQRSTPFPRPELKNTTISYCSKLEFEENALAKSVRNLSKGMLQKLGIIGCLLSDKPIQIFDEPMSGLDPKARVLFRDVVREQKSRNKTILLCTHILNDIETLCDRVGVLDHGKLLYVGSPAQCCTQFGAPDLEQAFLACLEKALIYKRK
jgi:ABC-2 type transport system ATP-binding protein